MSNAIKNGVESSICQYLENSFNRKGKNGFGYYSFSSDKISYEPPNNPPLMISPEVNKEPLFGVNFVKGILSVLSGGESKKTVMQTTSSETPMNDEKIERKRNDLHTPPQINDHHD